MLGTRYDAFCLKPCFDPLNVVFNQKSEPDIHRLFQAFNRLRRSWPEDQASDQDPASGNTGRVLC